MLFKKPTVVITGATGLLSSLVARTMADNGSNLVLLARDLEKLSNLVQNLGLPDNRVLALPVDFLDPIETKSVAKAVIAKFNQIDILIHLIGGWSGGKIIYEISQLMI
jgi:NADP-dependent 3-hydroxy acid dehydrogenase YdfG